MRCNIMFMFMWHNWHQHCHHMLPVTSSMALLHLLGKDEWKKGQNILVMWHHWLWCCHHVTLMVFSMAQLHSVSNNNQTELQHDFFGQLTSLAPLLIMWYQWHCQWHHYIHWVNKIEMRCYMTFWVCDTTDTGVNITWCQQHFSCHCCTS